jgi:hypothetical protein
MSGKSYSDKNDMDDTQEGNCDAENATKMMSGGCGVGRERIDAAGGVASEGGHTTDGVARERCDITSGHNSGRFKVCHISIVLGKSSLGSDVHQISLVAFSNLLLIICSVASIMKDSEQRLHSCCTFAQVSLKLKFSRYFLE